MVICWPTWYHYSCRRGINSTCSGSAEAIDSTVELVVQMNVFNRWSKIFLCRFCPFSKFKVKKKPEIVVSSAGADQEILLKYLEPEEWNDLISDPDVITIDTRNDYE